jgi:hypothetical protein
VTKIYRDKHLLKLAQDQFCLLQVKNFCRGGSSSTVACHHNSSKSGKGMGIKSSDAYTVWGCFSCHQWLDQGSASKEEKEETFQVAHLRQIEEWHKIATNIAARPWKVEAARAVLKHLENQNG